MRVFGEMCDSRTVQMHVDDFDDFPNLAGRDYRCQYAREIIIIVSPPVVVLLNLSHFQTRRSKQFFNYFCEVGEKLNNCQCFILRQIYLSPENVP